MLFIKEGRTNTQYVYLTTIKELQSKLKTSTRFLFFKRQRRVAAQRSHIITQRS